MSEKLNIWGREFKLDVNYEIVDEDKITEKQKQTRTTFCEKAKELLSDPKEIINYCLKKDGNQIEGKIDNIFKYVIPQELFIGEGRVSLMCNYRFDSEHGIAIVYENNKIIKICPQDEIF